MPAQGYYDAEFAPWSQGIRRIGTMIAAQPVMQANARAREQESALMAARARTEGDQQGKLRAETAAIEQDTGGRSQLSAALRRLTSNPKDPAALADAFEGTAQALRHDPEGTSKALGTLLGQMKALGGDVAGAADVTDPVAMEKNRGDNASREKIAGERGVILTPGSGQWKDGVRVANQPSAASQREGEYEETSTVYPATEEKAAVPPRTTGSLWWKKEVPGKPAVPGTPARTVTTRRKLGDAASAPMANQSQDPNDTEDATDPGGPEEQGEPSSPLSSTSYSMKATTTNEPPIAVAPSPKKPMTPDIAMAYLKKHGNRAAAEAAAKQDGYSW